MSLKRGFLWGKLSGILTGGVFGSLSYSLPLLLSAALDGRIQSEPDMIFLFIAYSFSGGFAGVFVGAVIGTVMGVIIAWAKMADNAPTIWLVVWTVAALFCSLLTFIESNEPNLLLPAIWVWLGGIVGWYGGLLYQSKATTNLKKAPVA